MIDPLIRTLAAAAALLLAASGVAKLQRPDPAATTVLRLRFLRLPGRPRAQALVRVIGAGELGVGLAVLVTGSRPAAALLAAAYLAFAAVAVVLLRAGGARVSCGCFGSVDSPLGAAHLALNVAAGAAGFAAVLRPPGPGAGLFAGGGAGAVAAPLQAVVLAALGYLAVTALPALLAAQRSLTPSTAAKQAR